MEEKLEHFQIYGRTSYEKPLSFVKEFMVKGDAKAEALAEAAGSGDEGWVELVAIPTAAFLHVIGKQEDD
ncbi:MAG: hypothetical protein AAF614_41235 [Chloroflexota bacterium]